jgi:hypothetical protein
MSERPIYSNAEILAELRREYDMRRSVYARYVAAGSMTPETAHKRQQIIDQVIQDYRRQDAYSDLFAIRTAASKVWADLLYILKGVPTTPEQDRQGADRIARAMKEGR